MKLLQPPARPNRHDVLPWESDVVASETWAEQLRPRSCRTPEHHLLMAVLEDAIDVLRKYSTALIDPQTLPRIRTLVVETRAWFASTAHDRLFDFESICEAFSLEPSAVRRALSTPRAAAPAAHSSLLAEHQHPVDGAPVVEPEIGLNGLTIAEATRVYLRAVGYPKTTQQITSALLKGGLSTRAENVNNCVHTQLTVAAKRGQVRRLGRAWALPEWEGKR